MEHQCCWSRGFCASGLFKSNLTQILTKSCSNVLLLRAATTCCCSLTVWCTGLVPQFCKEFECIAWHCTKDAWEHLAAGDKRVNLCCAVQKHSAFLFLYFAGLKVYHCIWSKSWIDKKQIWFIFPHLSFLLITGQQKTSFPGCCLKRKISHFLWNWQLISKLLFHPAEKVLQNVVPLFLT